MHVAQLSCTCCVTANSVLFALELGQNRDSESDCHFSNVRFMYTRKIARPWIFKLGRNGRLVMAALPGTRPDAHADPVPNRQMSRTDVAALNSPLRPRSPRQRGPRRAILRWSHFGCLFGRFWGAFLVALSASLFGLIWSVSDRNFTALYVAS